jgi:predicted dehydrogenase
MGPIKRMSWNITDWYRSQSYYDSGSWRATWAGEGGGVLLNQCPHQLDLLQWLFGMPTTVRAFCHEAKWHDIEVEDDVTAYLEFPSGSTGVFIASTGDLPGSNRLEVSFDRGKIVCEDGKLLRWALPGSEEADYRPGRDAYPHPDIEPEVLETDGENPQHIGVINAFAAHILTGSPLVAEGSEGVNALMLSNAMHLSSWLGKPVTTPIDEQLFAGLLAERAKHSRLKDTKDVTFTTDHSATGRAL